MRTVVRYYRHTRFEKSDLMILIQDRPLFGAHMPTAGGVHNAITSGKAIGCDTVQVFTASPRQWKSKPLADTVIDAYRSACIDCGIAPTIAHDSYLINLA